MRDREPEPWESGAPGPFLWIATAQGNMEMWALGEGRVLVRSPGHEQIVVGFEEAQRTADELAERLD